MKKKRMDKIVRGRPVEGTSQRRTLPGVRVIESQYNKVCRLAKKQNQTLSETIRCLISASL